MLPGLRLDLRRPHAPHVVQIAACEDDGVPPPAEAELRARWRPDRTSAALQQYEFSSRDLDALTQDILNSGQDLFEAVAMVLALEKDGESALTAALVAEMASSS